MKRFYSRLATLEERRNLRNTVIFTLLTIAVIILLFFVGIPLMGKLAVFVSDLRGGGSSISKNDTTPPAPPKFNSFPDFTNQQNISISGTTEAGATIKLTFNGDSKEALADKNGNFSFDIQLINGDNTFSATSADLAGNQSKVTQVYKIIFDNKPPTLTINSPSDGSSFFGSSQIQITIQGTTEASCQVTINDRIISVDDSGNFQYTTTLNSGENKFAVKSVDQAGNTTEKSITLNFTS